MIWQTRNRILLIIFFIPFQLIAQEHDVFIYENAIYKANSSWITIGVGSGYNFDQKQAELAGSIIYHQNVKKIALMAGYHMYTSESFLSRSFQTMTNFSVGAGYRIENLKSNKAAFIGPAWAFGRTLVSADQYFRFSNIGLMANIEYTYKLFYDVGLGV